MIGSKDVFPPHAQRASRRNRRRTIAPAAVAAATMCVALLAGASAAWAGPALSTAVTVPQSLAVGNTGVPTTLQILNTSVVGPGETGYDSDTYRIDAITLVPSCGSQIFSADCPVSARDAGVVVPAPLSASGRAGTACAGRTFTIANIDAAQGKYQFTPNATILLGAANGPVAAARCIIDFTASVLKVPTIDSDPDAGLQTDQKAFASTTDVTPGLNLNQTAGGIGTAQTTIAPPPPPPPVAPPPPPPVAPPPPPPPPCTPPPGPAPPGGVLCAERNEVCTPPPGPAPAGGKLCARGTAAIRGRTGCQGIPFRVAVSGRQIQSVLFTMDGKKVRMLTRPNSGSLYVLNVNPRTLRTGVHRVLARTIFRKESGTRSRTLRVTFSRCARRAVSPAFTG